MEYTRLKKFYAWVGFIALVVISLVLIAKLFEMVTWADAFISMPIN